MLYRTLKRKIERGMNDGMSEKLDIFFAADKLTQEQYTELSGMMQFLIKWLLNHFIKN